MARANSSQPAEKEKEKEKGLLESIRPFYQWLREPEQGPAISSFDIVYTPEERGHRGRFYHDDKSGFAQGRDQREAGPAAMHEMVHAVQPIKRSRMADTLRQVDELKSSFWSAFTPDLVYPTHWTLGSGQEHWAENPRAMRSNYGNDFAGSKLQSAVIGKVAEQVPPNMSFSGIRSENPWPDKQLVDEAQAYLLTDPELGLNPKRQRRALGCFLLDRGMPVERILPLLDWFERRQAQHRADYKH